VGFHRGVDGAERRDVVQRDDEPAHDAAGLPRRTRGSTKGLVPASTPSLPCSTPGSPSGSPPATCTPRGLSGGGSTPCARRRLDGNGVAGEKTGIELRSRLLPRVIYPFVAHRVPNFGQRGHAGVEQRPRRLVQRRPGAGGVSDLRLRALPAAAPGAVSEQLSSAPLRLQVDMAVGQVLPISCDMPRRFAHCPALSIRFGTGRDRSHDGAAGMRSGTADRIAQLMQADSRTGLDSPR